MTKGKKNTVVPGRAASREGSASQKAETITNLGDAPGEACHRVGESQEQTGEPHAHCRRAARGAGPGRLEVDAARRSLQDSPGSLALVRLQYAVFWSGKVLRQEWPISVADRPAAFEGVVSSC